MDTVESIQKNILFFGNLKIVHKLILGKSNQTKQKISNITSSEFNSGKYSNTNKVSNLTVTTSDYLVFEHTSNPTGEKKYTETIYFSYPNMRELKSTFKKVVGWFKKYPDMYVETNEGIFINDRYENLHLVCYGASGKTITLRPTVFDFENDPCRGVCVVLNDTKMAEIELFEFMSLSEFLNSFDLYQSSLLLYQVKELYVNNSPHLQISYGNSDGGFSSNYKPKTRKK